MTAHKRRHTTQPFALCKLSYTIFWRDTQQHMDVIRASLCFYDFYPFLFAQLSQNLPNILFNLPVYCHPTILWRKNYVILASPCCVLQCFDILLFHMKRPPGFIVAVGRPQLYSTRRSFALYNFSTLPGRAGGCLFAEANRTNPNAPSKRSTFGFAWYGAPSGTRTQDPLIKSQLLYQLS